jgi:hypothetical protein
MCCLFTVLVFFGARLADILWWILQPVRWYGNTSASAFNSILWPILGIIFLPWATLMYVIVAPGGLTGFDWVWVGLGVLFDVLSYGGGGYGNRDRIPGYGS